MSPPYRSRCFFEHWECTKASVAKPSKPDFTRKSRISRPAGSPGIEIATIERTFCRSHAPVRQVAHGGTILLLLGAATTIRKCADISRAPEETPRAGIGSP